MSTSQIFQVLEGHTSDITGCDFMGDYLATCSSDKTIKIWVYGSNGHFMEAEFSPLLEHTYGVNCVRFSPFGTLLASCSTDGKVILWSVWDGMKVCEMKHSSGSPIRVCSFSPTGAMLATGGDDEKVFLWDVATKVLERHEAMIMALAFSPDGAFLLSCSTAGDILLWDARYGHGKCLTSVTDAHDLGVLCCDFSPQYEAVYENGCLCGTYTIATCGNDDLVKVWYIKTGYTKSVSLIMKLEGHSGNVMCCRFSPDGRILASTAGDRSITLWNPNSGQLLEKLEKHTRYVTCCAFWKSFLVSGSNDKTVVIWSLNKQELMNTALKMSSGDEQNCVFIGEKHQNITSWSVDDVANWLKSLKLEGLTETFQSNAIDGKELLYLTHENLLTALKVESLGHRNKILRGIQSLKNPLWQHVMPENDDEMVLSEFYCPITHDVMRCPVVAADGYSYEMSAIQEWLDNGNETSPMTNEILTHKHLTPNHVLLQLIQKYRI
ncbi:WD repeat, SAM and U-box domain-containing protein 1-like isoform X2 [Uloborus diversus]|uniref:WD repeat, SAM and U-box domain-containing protein 1-like isoform X2 n=1 Tax=Uloborus diversus TaxID=327109 RepID=UPI0024099260|nr:WD repeat, SAM and U-box domain-containing protein 1-like isoform X2 [Uloborus diversus]